MGGDGFGYAGGALVEWSALVVLTVALHADWYRSVLHPREAGQTKRYVIETSAATVYASVLISSPVLYRSSSLGFFLSCMSLGLIYLTAALCARCGWIIQTEEALEITAADAHSPLDGNDPRRSFAAGLRMAEDDPRTARPSPEER